MSWCCAPVIERLRAHGHEVQRHRPRLRPDARAVRPLRHRAHGDRPPPGRRPARQGARPGRPLGALTRWARAPRAVRPGHRPRLQRHHRGRARCCGSRAPPRSTTSGPPCSTTSTAGWPRPWSSPRRSRPSAWTATARGASWRAIRGSRRSTTWRTSSPTAPSWPRWAWIPPSRSPWCAPRRRCRSITASRTTSSARCSIGCAAPRRWSCRGPPSSAPSWPAPAASSSPSSAIDAQSLIAYADLVVSAGGTMNREAVALGTPVFTVFEGRLGAVDERLIAEGRLARLERPDQVQLVKRDPRDDPRSGPPRARAARSGGPGGAALAARPAPMSAFSPGALVPLRGSSCLTPR